MSTTDPSLVPAQPPPRPGPGPVTGLFALPGTPNASIPIRSMCTTGSSPCPSRPSDAAQAAYAQCLQDQCADPVTDLATTYTSARVAREPATQLGVFPAVGVTPTMRPVIEQAAAAVEVCGIDKCRSEWIAVSSTICVPLDSPAIVSRGFHLPALPTSATTNATLVRLFQSYQSAVSTHMQPPSAQDPSTIDQSAFTAAMLGSNADTSSLDKLGVCVPTLPVGSACDARAWDQQANLPALGRIVPNFASTGKSAVLAPASPSSSLSPGFPIHAVRVPPAGPSPPAPELVAQSQRSGNTFTSITCVDGAVAPTAPKLPGADCSSHPECLLGMCVPSPSSSTPTCRLVDRLATSTPPQPPIIEQPSNPTSDTSSSSDGTLSALASPILWAQLTAIILASILLLGWSRGGIEWRKRVQARLVRALARVRPAKSTVARELACDPADNRMLASYRPRSGRRRRERGTRALRVRYLPDGTPEWIEERVEDDEPLPLYVPRSPPAPAPAPATAATADTSRRASLVDPERAPLLAHPSAAAAADIRRARRGSVAAGAPAAVGSPRLSGLLVGGPPPPPFSVQMPRPASLDSMDGGSSAGSRRGSLGAETFEGIDDGEVDMEGEVEEWRFGHR